MMKCIGKISVVLVLALITLPAGVMAAAPISTIDQGNTVFLGEEGLDVTAALKGAYYGVSCGYSMDPSEANAEPPLTAIGWWASAAGIFNTAPSQTIDLGSSYRNIMVSPSDFVGYTGNWYLLGQNGMAWSPKVEGCGCSASGCTAALVFTVQDPNLDIRVEDATLGYDATNGWIPLDDEIQFRITTNLYQITQRPGVSFVPIEIHVQSPDGASYSALINKAGTTTSITDIPVSSSPYSTGPIWDTGRRDAYPPGTYRVWAECNVNNMKDNYPVSGKTYTPDRGILDEEMNPLIAVNTRTATPTTLGTRVPTTTRTTVAPTVATTATAPPTELTTPPTATPTVLPTALATASQTKSPGFESVLAGAALLLILVWSVRKE
jgi:hypothetical protein